MKVHVHTCGDLGNDVCALAKGLGFDVTRSPFMYYRIESDTRLILCTDPGHECQALPCSEVSVLSFHPSLLPFYRSGDAIAEACRDGQHVTGGTLSWAVPWAPWTGPVVAQEFCFIRRGDSPLSLWAREFAPMAFRMFDQTLTEIAAGRIPAGVLQNEADARR